MKDKTVAYLLWAGIAMGVAGLHRIYLGKYGTGFLYLFTWGLFGIGQLVDLFTIPGMVEDANNRLLVHQMAGVLPAGTQAALPGRRAPRNTEEFQVVLVQARAVSNQRRVPLSNFFCIKISVSICVANCRISMVNFFLFIHKPVVIAINSKSRSGE